jgi:hypothetical protein
MPIAESERNKATFTRMIDAANSDDLETFSKAVDELSEPNAVLHTPAAQGPAYKEVFAALYRATRTFTSRLRT